MSTFDLDTTYSAVTGEHIGGMYVPAVEHSDDYDILIDGNVTRGRYFGSEPRPEWDALTGYTQQYGYRGAVMHPSETMSDDAIREAVREAGGDVFAIVPVEACQHVGDLDFDCVDQMGGCDCDPAGWAVLYRAA